MRLSHKIKKSEFVAFFEEMISEYDRHLLAKGDSWKTIAATELQIILNEHIYNYLKPMTLAEEIEELVDIANLCGMLWHRLKELQED